MNREWSILDRVEVLQTLYRGEILYMGSFFCGLFIGKGLENKKIQKLMSEDRFRVLFWRCRCSPNLYDRNNVTFMK